jgi:hypothetical protein
MITTKQIDQFIRSQLPIAIQGDNGSPVLIRFTARDRSYGEYIEILSGHSGKLHREDITLSGKEG